MLHVGCTYTAGVVQMQYLRVLQIEGCDIPHLKAASYPLRLIMLRLLVSIRLDVTQQLCRGAWQG